eukprot:910561-Rhodomonas_salina.3
MCIRDRLLRGAHHGYEEVEKEHAVLLEVWYPGKDVDHVETDVHDVKLCFTDKDVDHVETSGYARVHCRLEQRRLVNLTQRHKHQQPEHLPDARIAACIVRQGSVPNTSSGVKAVSEFRKSAKKGVREMPAEGVGVCNWVPTGQY